ncbi:MAG: hypothetical protein AB7V56_07795 [Candidatus Nitrosocosmicus sp.]
MSFSLLFKNNMMVVIILSVVLILGNTLSVYPISNHSENNKHLTMLPHHEFTLQNQNLSDNISSQSYAEQIFLSCQNSDNEHCPMMGLDEINKIGSQTVVLETFLNLVRLYDENNYLCHHEGHHLGMWLYEYTQNLTRALKSATVLCGGAVYHGIFQSFFGEEKFINIKDKNNITITNLCPVGQVDVSWLHERDCIHGIGHGLVKLYNYDTKTAAERCDEFIPLWAKSACSRGVFMENYEYHFDTGKGDIDLNDIYFPCNKSVDKFAPQCYYYFPEYEWERKNVTISYNLADAYGECDGISPSKFAKYCYQGIGRLLSFLASTNPDVPVAACNIANESSHREDCMVGTLKTILKGDGKTDVGFNFCGSSNPEFKATCYYIMGIWIKMYLYTDKQDWENECNKAVDKDYVDNCIRANPDASVGVRMFEPV